MRPAPLPASTLATERLLEDMIVASPEILSDEWMLTRVDLVAIAPDGALILIKIKRDRTPREVSEPMRHGDQPPKKSTAPHLEGSPVNFFGHQGRRASRGSTGRVAK
jgi:hypothetical protein